ncbi:hypothetical protein [Paenibacillus flagellatus]|uniref:Flagellar protein n=1 Tax=Paenibacillus flagellatus TaxID=2211139 RepID=A0A2V5KQB2_9BACL|nr:hypothetical protein [Paenibacillus flagellatus]PYI50816.1 hypothetical protein DLM86_27485 [Paenibacillus flagellatus]
MSLANCKSCGRLFVRQKSEHCDACRERNERDYFTMRNFLKANPRSTVLDIHEKTGIPLSKVLEMRKESFAPYGH